MVRPKPGIYPSIKEFFESNNIKGTVISTEPYSVAYIDNKFIPNFWSYPVLVKDFESDETITTMIYFIKGIWCDDSDEVCLEQRQNTTAHMTENYNLVLFDNETDTYIFSKNFSLPSIAVD